MPGVVSLFGSPVQVLFDSGSGLSYIARKLVYQLGLTSVTMLKDLVVNSPLGISVTFDQICKGSNVRIRDIVLSGDLIVMEMGTFDIILGMDWFSANHTKLDCFQKAIIFNVLGRADFIIYGS